jgi:hypothetical protein
MNKIEMMPFPAQALLFAKLSELAYKDIKTNFLTRQAG